MTKIPREWVATRATEWVKCPPASPHLSYFGLATCRKKGSGNHWGYTCTRIKGHTGRHAASGLWNILAVWE